MAAIALGKIGDKRAVESLIAALRDTNSDVRENAAKALGRIGWKPVNQTERSIYLMALQEWDEVVKIGAPAIAPLIAVLRDEDANVRRNAAKDLGKIGDKRAVEPLIAILEDPDWRIRSDAVLALGKIGDKKAVDPLIDALKDKDSSVRRMAAETLGKIGDERAVEPLIAALRDKNLDVRKRQPGHLVC